MSRTPNFYYQGDPTADVASSLARAIFGDPEAAARQREQQAIEMERAARTRSANAQAIGQENQNTAATGLPALFARLQSPPPPPLPSLDDPGFLDGAGPSAPMPDRDAVFRDNLAPVIAALAQMQGDKVVPRQSIGTLASFFGGDEMARRGLVAQGHSPSADFAISPDRADQIAQQGYDADQTKAFGVAGINRKSAFDVATLNNRDKVAVANIQAGASRYGADTRAGSARYAVDAVNGAPGFDAITRALPGATMNSGLRTPERKAAVGGAANSYHLGTHSGAQGYDIPPQPWMTVDQAKAQIENANPGVRVVEALDEGDHWHFALQNTGGGAKGGKWGQPATASKADMTVLSDALDNYETANRIELSDRTKASLKNKAIAAFQRNGGNVIAAIQEATALLEVNGQRVNARGQKAAAKPSITVSNW